MNNNLVEFALGIMAVSSVIDPYYFSKFKFYVNLNPKFDIYYESPKSKIRLENKRNNLIQKKYPTKTFYQNDCISK